MRNVALVALRCRTSDRTAGGARGAEALALELGERLGVEPRLIGAPEQPRVASWADDLRKSRGCILEAGGQVDDALAGERFPVLCASDCSICLTTLPAVVRHHPDVRLLWLDAHGDFNTPETTPSGFLGGMCLAAACGVWHAGFDGVLDPTRVVMCGVRDLDAGERVAVEAAEVLQAASPTEALEALAGEEVYVHLDLDVLDPDVFPAQFPAPHGLSAVGLRHLLAGLASSATVVGLEVTAFEAPADEDERERLAALVAGAIDPLLSGAPA